MGFRADPVLWNEFLSSADRNEFGGGSCSSRLLTGNHPAYASLEKRLAVLYGAESALVFDSGWHATGGLLPALTSSKDLILADKLVHASIIDGIRLSDAECIRYPHGNLERLETLLEKRREDYDNVFIVTESVFSMDGDCADLRRLAELKRKYGAFLYVDEAHAFGVRGKRGLGLAEEQGVIAEIDFLVGTFGKAAASQGAFAVTDDVFREYLVNTMRPLIFSTSLPPVSVRWTEFVVERLTGMESSRRHLERLGERLRERLTTAGLETAGKSQIVPLIVRDNRKAIALSEYLCENGFFVLPIRRPTVPPGGERLRISLTASLTEIQIETLSELCARIGR